MGKADRDLREGMARIKKEGEDRQREIKQRKAAEARQRMGDASKQLDDFMKMALFLRAAGDRKGLRELMRQAMHLGKQAASDAAASGEGALAVADIDPEGAMKALNETKRQLEAIEGQLQGLAAMAEDGEEEGTGLRETARSLRDAGRDLPEREMADKLSWKGVERLSAFARNDSSKHDKSTKTISILA
jgi:hypothetical protein